MEFTLAALAGLYATGLAAQIGPGETDAGTQANAGEVGPEAGVAGTNGASATDASAPLENAGEPINTPFDEFAPSVTADGRMLVFNSRRSGEDYQNLYVSYFREGRWTAPQPMRALNSPYNDETPMLTPDGSLIFFASDRDGSAEMPADERGRIRVSFDIYWARREGDGWSRPLRVPGDVNTATHERAPALDERTNTLYFSRWPFGDSALDNSTVYSADYQDGRFRNVQKLPESINAGYGESAFTPARDKPNGFYFSSRRPGGLGGWDIYYVEQNESGEFGEPRNAGPAINSDAHEVYYSTVGGRGWLASNRAGGAGRYDIYGQPAGERVVFEVRDARSKKPLQVTVEAQSGERKGRVETDANGQFMLDMPESLTRLRMSIEESGYLPYEGDFAIGGGDPDENTPGATNDATISGENVRREDGKYVIELQPVEADATFAMRAIHFDANKDEIKRESHPVLDRVVRFLERNPGLRLEIIGHTDLHGPADYNLDLSERRAAAVRAYLESKGVAESRLETKGLGFSRPAVDRKGEPYDEQNRRTEFRILDTGR